MTLGSKKPFYARNSAGKYPLDVDPLREKFIEQYRLREEIEELDKRDDHYNLLARKPQ